MQGGVLIVYHFRVQIIDFVGEPIDWPCRSVCWDKRCDYCVSTPVVPRDAHRRNRSPLSALLLRATVYHTYRGSL